jgi:hypothetical protein
VYSPSIFSTFDDELALYSGDEIFFSPQDDRTVIVRFSLSERRRRSPMSAYSTVMNVMGSTKNSSVESVNETVDSFTSVSISCIVLMLHCVTSGMPSYDETVNCNACK